MLTHNRIPFNPNMVEYFDVCNTMDEPENIVLGTKKTHIEHISV